MDDQDRALRSALPMDEIEELCRRYRVRELSVFGSLLQRGLEGARDVDLLVEFEEGAEVGFLGLARMQRELSAIIGRPVDLVPKAGLKRRIRQEVLNSARVLYAA